MPPKKQRNPSVAPSSRLTTRKRKCESTINTGSTRKKQKKSNKSDNEIDTFCWICHKSGQSRQFKKCGKCPRVYHHECTTELEELDTKCPECQAESVDGTEISKRLSSEIFLRKLLHLCVSRVFGKKREDFFLAWPESLGKNKLVKIIDSEILRDNINRPPYYKKTARFYSDVKFMYHNCAILFKDKSRLTNAAKLVEDFKQELLDIEACPQCYYNMYHQDSVLANPFVTLCEPPHEIIWAHLKGWTYWPAKCLKVVNNDNGSKIASVRFFGKHEKSNIPLEDCYRISKGHPKYHNSQNSDPFSSGPKRPHYRGSIKELIEYIDLYTQKYGDFAFSEYRTPFRPMNARSVKDKPTKVVEATNAGNSSFALRNGALMKLEANKIESADIGSGVMPQSSVLEFSENHEPNLNECDRVNPIDSANEHVQSQYSYTQIDKQRAISGVAGGISHDVGKQLNGNVSVIMTFEQEPSPSNANGGDLIDQTPLVLSVSSLSEEYSAVPSTSIVSPGNQPMLDLNSITSGDDCTKILNTIAEVSHAIKMVESHSVENELNISADLEQDSNNGDDPQESGSGQASGTSPRVTDISSAENIVPEDNAGIEIVVIDDDDDVVIEPPTTSDAPAFPEQTPRFNPTLVLHEILEKEKELQEVFELGKYVTEAMFVRLWASASNIPSAPEKITAALEKYRKQRDNNATLLRENNTMAENLKNMTEVSRTSLVEITRIKSQLEEEQQKRLELECRAKEAQINAKLIITSLKEKAESIKASYSEKMFLPLLKCEQKLLEKDTVLKETIEELEQTRKELDNLKREKQKVDDALKQIQEEHGACAGSKYDPEEIIKFKIEDYCRVCYSVASIHCCVNHNYCSGSHKNDDYKTHHKSSENPIHQNLRSKLEQQSTVQSITQEKINESKINICLELKKKSLVSETLITEPSIPDSEILPMCETTIIEQEKSSYVCHRTLLPTPSSSSHGTSPGSSRKKKNSHLVRKGRKIVHKNKP